ncbi:MAG: hypothetical protein IPF63_05975 [Bacteroidetes bacterium]|nr:hypothetical protein [Bacteroidota bacterium]
MYFCIRKKNDDVGQASTEEFAKAIKALLGDCDECIKPIALTDVSDGKTIESDLTDYLKTHLTTSTEITYNYTGGTKSMSVHIYNWFRKNYPCAKFSYLNARKDSLIMEVFSLDNNPTITTTSKKDISTKVTLTFEQLAKLHLYNYANEKTEYNGLLNSFMEFYLNGEKIPNWQKSLYNFFKVKSKISFTKNDMNKNVQIDFNDFKNKLKEALKEKLKEDKYKINECCLKSEIDKVVDAYPDQKLLNEFFKNQMNFNSNNSIPVLVQINNFLDDELKIFEGENGSRTVKLTSFNDPTKFNFFLDWVNYFMLNQDLEHYCYKLVEALKNPNNLNGCTSIGMNWVFAKDANFNPKSKDANFELDVLVLFGYRLYVISVTRQQEIGDIKRKGFEVLHRARQLGGEEAKAVILQQ